MSGLDPSESGWEDEALDAAREFLDESTSRASFSIELSPGPDLRYGIHYEVGDLVLAYIGQDENSQPVGLIEDLIEEAEITWNEEGERAAVNIGGAATETTNRRLERWIRLLQRQLHYQGLTNDAFYSRVPRRGHFAAVVKAYRYRRQRRHYRFQRRSREWRPHGFRV